MPRVSRISRIAAYVSDFKSAFAIGFLVMLAITAAGLAGPLILRSIIDDSIPRGDLPGMLLRALAYLGVVIAMGGLTFYGTIVISRLGLRVVMRIKKELFAQLLTLPVSYFDAHPVGELMARTENDTEKVKELFSRVGITLATNILFLLGMLAVCFVLDPRVTGYIALALPLVLAFVLFFFDRLRPFYERHRKLYAAVVARVTEFIQGIEVLRAFGRVPWAEARLAAESKARRDNDVKSQVLEYTVMGGLGFFIGPAFMAAVIVLLAPGILQGRMTIGTLLVFIEYGRRIFDPIMAIAENVRSIQQARAALDRIFGILDLAPEAGGGPRPAEGRSERAVFGSTIEFRDVWFRYKEAEWVLQGVSFVIPKGSTLALVGPSGSGKTTTVALLCRFYEPERGEILVDGRPLRELELESWRRSIGLVLQDVYLFPGSVLENVRVYDDAIDRESVRGALAAVRAEDFVSRLPEGFDQELRERGANLSAGERQLLSFARAVAFGPEIIVLDEATASIDVKTERRIREGMRELTMGRTAVIVAHRLSSVLAAEQILFFKEGRIAARGRHAELVEAFPEYAELVRLQFFAAGAEA